MAIETRELLADSYWPGGRRTMLTHAVSTQNGKPLRVLCGRIRLDSVAGPYDAVVNTEPTCKRCASLWRRTVAEGRR